MKERIRHILKESAESIVEINGVDYGVEEVYEESEGGGEDTSMEEVLRYLKKLKELWETGGEVYRIIYVESKKDVKRKNPGCHWLAFRDAIEGNIGYLADQPMVYDMKDPKPFLLIGHIKPHVIDVENCVWQFKEYPMEFEITECEVRVTGIEEL